MGWAKKAQMDSRAPRGCMSSHDYKEARHSSQTFSIATVHTDHLDQFVFQTKLPSRLVVDALHEKKTWLRSTNQTAEAHAMMHEYVTSTRYLCLKYSAELLVSARVDADAHCLPLTFQMRLDAGQPAMADARLDMTGCVLIESKV
jgi:hypothetical protein